MKKDFVGFEKVKFELDKLADPGSAFYYGKNRSGAPLYFNRNMFRFGGQGLILGTAGSGKSCLAQNEILNILLKTNDDVIVISSDGVSYHNLAKFLNVHALNEHFSSVVNMAVGSDVHINPMDMNPNYADEDEPITLKFDFIISLCETALGNLTALTAVQRSIIDRCCRQVYKPFLTSRNKNGEYNKRLTPTFLDFQKVLEEQPEEEAKQLALCLDIYARGSLNIFAHSTNVNTDARFVIYETGDLPPALKGFATLTALNAAWNKVVENCRRGRRTWIYIDDCYYLLKAESSYYFTSLFNRARIFGGTFTLITQDVSMFLKNDLTRAIFSTCDFMQVLNIASGDREILSEVFNSNMFGYYGPKPFPSGEGLIYDGQTFIPVSFNSLYITNDSGE